MGKYNTDWSEEKFKRFLKEGRGQGEGKDYKPWLTVQDFPSKGRSSRVRSIKTGRIHHFLSDIETRYFYFLEYDEGNKILDIREFYPLLDFEEVVQDKGGLRIDLFADKKTGCPYVLTTTFLVTLNAGNGKTNYAARSIKAASELEKNITLQKLEIERRYWQAKGVDWAVVTNKDINPIKAKNVEWVISSLHSLDDTGFTENDLVELGTALILRIYGSTKPIRSITADFDRDYSLDNGTGLFLFRYLIAKKAIKIDMDSSIDLNASAGTVQIVKEVEEGLKIAGG